MTMTCFCGVLLLLFLNLFYHVRSTEPNHQEKEFPKKPILSSNTNNYIENSNERMSFFSLETLEEDSASPVEGPKSKEFEAQKQLDELLACINYRGEMIEEEYRLLIDYVDRSFASIPQKGDLTNCLIWGIDIFQLVISNVLSKFLLAANLPKDVVEFVKTNEKVLENEYQNHWTPLREQEKAQRLDMEKCVAHNIWGNLNTIACLEAISKDHNAQNIFLHLYKEWEGLSSANLKKFYEVLCSSSENENKVLCDLLERLFNQTEKYKSTFNLVKLDVCVKNYEITKQNYIDTVQKVIKLQHKQN